MGPSSRSTVSTAVSTAARLATSVGVTTALPPALRISSAVSSSCDLVRAMSPQAYPSLASDCAISRPMPRPAPVIRATLMSDMARILAISEDGGNRSAHRWLIVFEKLKPLSQNGFASNRRGDNVSTKAIMNIYSAWKLLLLTFITMMLAIAPRAIADDIDPDADVPDISTLSDPTQVNPVLEIPQQCDQDSVAVLCDRSADDGSASPDVDANADGADVDANDANAVAN